jgi:hypothetical protein
MKRLMVALFLLFPFTGRALSTSPDLTPFHKIFSQGELYAGFGLARDLLAHVYFAKDFRPRDYDFAVIASGLTKEEAMARLGEIGQIRKVIDTGKEVLHPNGNVTTYTYGFVVILDYNGQQLDFKFFDSIDDAHVRGIFDVEKILFPLNGQSIEVLAQELRQIHAQGDIPSGSMVSDPYNGVTSFLNRTARTVNWAKATSSPIEWIIRGAMIHAKMGSQGIHPEELQMMRSALGRVRYMWKNDYPLVDRAIRHRQWWRVRETLELTGFFDVVPNLRWSEPVRKQIQEWRMEPIESPMCRRLFL